MALASTTAENQALASLSGGATNVVAYVNMCTGSPGTTGANESTFTRQACTWNTPSGGSMTNASALTFSGTSQTATYFGTWSASTSGTYGIGGALTSSVTASSITVAAGALTLSAS